MGLLLQISGEEHSRDEQFLHATMKVSGKKHLYMGEAYLIMVTAKKWCKTHYGIKLSNYYLPKYLINMYIFYAIV